MGMWEIIVTISGVVVVCSAVSRALHVFGSRRDLGSVCLANSRSNCCPNVFGLSHTICRRFVEACGSRLT